MANYSYSFLDAQLAINGPGGTFSLKGGNADEGISFAMTDDKSTMQTGADGLPMHSLHASRSGKITLRVQKVSPLNQQLNTMYYFDTQSAANHGQNTISFRDPVRGDSWTGQSCAFKKQPDVAYAKDADILEWEFDAGFLDRILGNGAPSAT